MNFKNVQNWRTSLAHFTKYPSQYVRYSSLYFVRTPQITSNFVRFLVSVIVVILFFSSNVAFGANSAGLVNGIWFATDTVTDFGETIVFSVLHNQTDEKLQGIATLVVDGTAVGAQEVNIGSGDIKQVGILHAFSSGTHSVRMQFTAGNATEVTFTELATVKIFVVQDTDGDGIQNTTDTDDDNDGIPDTEDAEPLVKQVFQKPSVDISETGRSFLNKILNRNSSDSDNENEELKEVEQEEAVTEDLQEQSTSTIAIVAAFNTLENARKRGAASVRGYEEVRREKLEEIARAEEALTAVEGFKPSKAQQSEKRENQLPRQERQRWELC